MNESKKEKKYDEKRERGDEIESKENASKKK